MKETIVSFMRTALSMEKIAHNTRGIATTVSVQRYISINASLTNQISLLALKLTKKAKAKTILLKTLIYKASILFSRVLMLLSFLEMNGMLWPTK